MPRPINPKLTIGTKFAPLNFLDSDSVDVNSTSILCQGLAFFFPGHDCPSKPSMLFLSQTFKSWILSLLFVYKNAKNIYTNVTNLP